jgi:hypothetical protein
MFGGS